MAGDWEPDYNRGTGVYETRHTPPMFVFRAEDEHGRQTMRGIAHPTREEAEADQERHEKFHHDFWGPRVELAATDPKACVIDGGYYSVGEDRPYAAPELCGFGGRQFYIARHDGQLIETRNLWFGGEVPRDYRERIPDNAEFVNGERWVLLGGVSYLAGP